MASSEQNPPKVTPITKTKAERAFRQLGVDILGTAAIAVGLIAMNSVQHGINLNPLEMTYHIPFTGQELPGLAPFALHGGLSGLRFVNALLTPVTSYNRIDQKVWFKRENSTKWQPATATSYTFEGLNGNREQNYETRTGVLRVAELAGIVGMAAPGPVAIITGVAALARESRHFALRARNVSRNR